MNPEEWKNTKSETVQKAYELLKQIGVTSVKPSDFADGDFYLDVPPYQFPYDQATEVRAQLEGTGERHRYELRFYYWVAPVRICQSFEIDTDEQNEEMLAILKRTDKETRNKVVVALEKGLAELLRYMTGDETYVEWRLQEPTVKAKIQRVKAVIVALE